ncbi:MAG: hypothetical protein E7607_08245 [Ruminococcaceae bacterium]|nr:hypothetical protein [Oscillospiraceae bacterium]
MGKTTLLIMAAGLGSRYGGNKQVDGIGPGGEILMQYSIYDAIRAGFNKIVFVIKPEHQSIIEGFCKDIKNAEIEFVYQDFSSIPSFYKIPEERIKPFGTVHAVLCARNAINEPFAVINADDFYGRDAFAVMHEKLVSLPKGESTMVAYYLENTVSKNGAVTRGICQVENGILRKVKETYKIVLDEKGSICDEESGFLDGKLPVSMNMWGFTPDIFDELDSAFCDFLKNIPDGEIKAEYALPTFIDKIITEKNHKVSVLSTSAVWFGVTYIEDRATVAAALLEKRNIGEYPERLF